MKKIKMGTLTSRIKKLGVSNLKISKLSSIKIGSFHNFGYRILGNTPSKYFPFSNSVRKSLNKIHFRLSHIIYISSMFFWVLLGMLLAAIIAFPLTFLLTMVNILELGAPWFVYPIGVIFGTGGIVMLTFLYYPHYISGQIKTGIDKNIIYIINYMSILAGAGATTENIFTSLSETGKIYNVQGSAKSIVRDIELLGKDITSAVDLEIANTPSRKFSKLLMGLNGISRTGGSLQHFLKESASRQIAVRRRELSKLVSSLNLAAEAYVVLGIAFPVILTTLLSMMGVFGGDIMAGLGPVQIMAVMTYVLFPIAALGVLLLIDGITSSW